MIPAAGEDKSGYVRAERPGWGKKKKFQGCRCFDLGAFKTLAGKYSNRGKLVC